MYCNLIINYLILIFNILFYSDETKGNLALIFELMEMNLYEAIKDRRKYLSEKKAKLWIYQILKALDFIHKNGIFHRDIKPENILLLNGQAKLADFGSCKGIYSKPPFTEYISTRWYRPPECLLTDGFYNYKMDIWGLGCVFFEILTICPLFPGDDEIDQVKKINYIIGSPSLELFNKFMQNSSYNNNNEFNYEYEKGVGIAKYLTHVSPKTIDLISKMINYDPDKRPTAKQCLLHECFSKLNKEELNTAKLSQVNFYHDSLLSQSVISSISGIKNDPSLLIINVNNSLVSNINSIINSSNKIETSNSNYNLIYKNTNNNKEKNNKNNYNYNYNELLLPLIKSNNINEDSKDKDIKEEDSLNNSMNNKKKEYIALPKIASINNRKFGGIADIINPNEYNKMLNIISNNKNNIDKIKLPIYNHYDKKPKVDMKKRINEIKKNYVSPYAKKNIENNIYI